MNRNFYLVLLAASILSPAALNPTVAFGQSSQSLAVNKLQVEGSTSSQGNISVAEPGGVVASPYVTISGDENGVSRNAAQQLVIEGASNPAQQLLIGYVTKPNPGYNDFMGYSSLQSTQSDVGNTPLMLNPNGGGVYVGTSSFAGDIAFVVGRGQGPALADEWMTYSSRRYKKDIATLPDALKTVEKLRGVSYTRRDNGKHEIGVIAEEVGAVVPEIVNWEENGKDARGVDYSRLTALLIEATKQQQTEIEKQSAELQDAMQTISMQQKTIKQMQVREQKTDLEVRALQSANTVVSLAELNRR